MIVATGERIAGGTLRVQTLISRGELESKIFGFDVSSNHSETWIGYSLFYWTPSYPFENSLLNDDHMMFVFLLFGLGAFGTGRTPGTDTWFEKQRIVKNNPWLTPFLG